MLSREFYGTDVWIDERQFYQGMYEVFVAVSNDKIQWKNKYNYCMPCP